MQDDGKDNPRHTRRLPGASPTRPPYATWFPSTSKLFDQPLGRSCLTNDECIAVDLIYLDFQKAFDKVPHERLLLKVASLGIRGNLQHWIRSSVYALVKHAPSGC